MLLVEVPVVLYQAITGQKSSRWSLLFQPVNFAGSRQLATTLIHTCICCGSILSLLQILFLFLFGYGNV